MNCKSLGQSSEERLLQPAFVKCGQQSVILRYPSDNRKSDPFINIKAAEQNKRAPFISGKRWTKGRVKARTKIPLRRLNWVCFIWQTGSPGPKVLRDSQVISAWVSSKADATRACLTHKEMSFKHPQNIGLYVTQLPGGPSKEKRGQIVPRMSQLLLLCC